MKRCIVWNVSVLSVLLLPPLAVGGDTTEAVEKKLIENWSKVQSLSAKLVMSADMGSEDQKGSAKGEGTFEYMLKDGKALFRNEMKMTQEFGGAQKMETSTLTISDGQFAYMLTDGMGQKMAMKRKAGEGGSGNPGGKEVFETLKKDNDLKLLPDDKVDGKDAYVIEAVPKAAEPTGPSTMVFFFHKDTGMMLKMVGKDKSGKQLMTMTYSDVQVNPKINPDRFVFKAPEGVQVMDMTGAAAPTP